MSRSARMWIWFGLSAVAFIVTAVIVGEIAGPRISRGAVAAPPVTPQGWIQLAVSALATFGFTGAGMWQAVASFVEHHLPSIVSNVKPEASDRRQQEAVDFSKIVSLEALITVMPDGAAKNQLIIGARATFDELRDLVFPATASQPAPPPPPSNPATPKSSPIPNLG